VKLFRDLESVKDQERRRIMFEEGPQMVHALEESLREWIFQVK
jgi:hypothetical protein